MQNRKLELGFSLFVTAFVTYLFLDIAFLNYGQGILSKDFTQTYYYILLAATVVLWIFLIVDFSKLIPRSSPISFGFIWDNDPIRPLGRPGQKMIWRILPHLIISLIFVVGVFGLKSAILPVPEAFNTDTLSQVSQADKIKYQSLDPGFGEEAVMFGFTCLFMLLFRTGFRALRFGEKTGFYISAFISSAITAGAKFIIGHKVAYGLNNAAYLSAFMFEFAAQLANQLTGIFLSWLPHTMHNFVVLVFAYAIVLSVGSEALLIMIMRKKDETAKT